MEKSNLYELSAEWSEPVRWLWRLKFALLYTMGAWNLADFTGAVSGVEMLPHYIAAATIFILGRALDKYSTAWNIEDVKRQRKLGLRPTYQEDNFYLPRKPKVSQLYDRKQQILDTALLVPAIIFPPFGEFLGLVSIGAAANNMNQQKGALKAERALLGK